MNNIINISKQDLLQTNISAVTSSVSIALGGVDAAVATNATKFEGSFQATFQKISDQSTLNGKIPVNEVTGNNLPADLPLTDIFPELSAESDHILSKQVLTTKTLTTNNIDGTNLLLSEDGHLMLNTNDQILLDENQPLTAETVLNRLAVTEEHIDAEQNYSVSSLMPALSPSVMNSSFSEIDLSRSQNVPDDRLMGNGLTGSQLTGELDNDLIHADLTNTKITKPVSGSITQSMIQPATQLSGQPVTQVELSPPLTTTSLQPTLGKTESLATNVVISEIAGEMTKETVSRNRLNNITHAEEKVSQASQLVSDKTLQTSASAAISNTVSKGENANEIHQNLISSNIPKQEVDNKITVLQDDLVTVDEISLKSKQSLYSQKLMGNVEQNPLKTNSVAASLSNIKFNNQDVAELNKLDAALTATMTGSTHAEEVASTVATINGFSPQLRSVLQTRSNTTISQLENVSVSQSENSVRLERSLMPSMDGLSLTTESSGLISDKIQNFSNALTQQQLFATTHAVQAQTASLVQAASNMVDINSDSLPGTMSPTLNNITNVNSLSLPQAEITESVGRSGWPQAMGKQVLSMINQNIGSAEIRLNPAHLGPIEILIDMTEDQVNVSLTSRHAVVREAMEQALPRLREMLDENGFDLADTDISKHSFADQREQNTKHNDQATDINGTTHDQLITTEITAPVTRGAAESTGIVDYFV